MPDSHSSKHTRTFQKLFVVRPPAWMEMVGEPVLLTTRMPMMAVCNSSIEWSVDEESGRRPLGNGSETLSRH